MSNIQKLHQLVRVLDDINQAYVKGGARQIIYYNERTREYGDEKPGLMARFVTYRAFEIDRSRTVLLEEMPCTLDNLKGSSKIRLSLKCRLQLMDGMEKRAVEWINSNPNADDALCDLLQQEISLFSQRNPDIQSRYFELEDSLLEQLIKRLVEIGFKSEIHIAPIEEIQHTNSFKLITQPITCPIREGKIVVICTLAMEGYDSRRTIMANIGSLEDHMESFLKGLLQNAFLKKNYATILQNFVDNSLQKELEEPVIAEATRIGYRVKNLFSIPQIEDFDCKDHFELSTDGNGHSNGGIEFETNADQVKIRLKVTVRGSISSFRGTIEQYLRPGTKLKEIMLKEMIQRMRSHLRRIRPERFFLYFDYPDPREGGDSLLDELKREIRNVLNDCFNVEILDLTITQHHTELTKAFQRLQTATSKIEVCDFPRRILYQIKFSVDHIDAQSWHIFMARPFQDVDNKMLEIGEDLGDFFELKFNTVNRFRMTVGTDSRFPNLLREMFKMAQEDIVAAHGLRLKLISMKPLPTEEAMRSDRYLDERATAMRDKLLDEQFDRDARQIDMGNDRSISDGLLDHDDIFPKNQNPQLKDGSSKSQGEELSIDDHEKK